MAENVTISNLPAASALVGDELVPLVQSGTTVRGTVSALLSGLPLATSVSNGLMPSTDKSKLDTATDASVNSTLVKRDSSGNTAVNTLTAARVTGLGIPTNGTDAANKSYVDAASAGLNIKNAVVAATVGTINLNAAPNTLDGKTLLANDRVLVKNQSDNRENGIYYVQVLGSGSNGTWQRTTDADTGAELSTGTYVFVMHGTANGNAAFVMNTPGIIVLGTSPILWTLFSQVTQILAENILGQLITSQLADGLLNTAKFAQGLTPVEVLDALPTTGNFVGRMVFLTTTKKLYRFDGTVWTASVPTVDLVGQVVSAQIADAAINTAKFAAGITPIEISGVLPTTGNFAGRQVFLTSDNKVYRYSSVDGWTTLIPSTDIGGQLISTQIANAAITTAKFASGITPVEIASTLPTTGNFVGRQVFLTSDSKVYRYNGTGYTSVVPATDINGEIVSTQISNNAITTDKIAANAITAGKIQAAAISATEIAAGAITADKIYANAVTSDKIVANAITADKIVSNAVSSDKIAANSITSDKIASNSITTGMIQAGAISATEIATNAITSDKINANAITADKIVANAITAGKIATDAITSDKIAANSITSAKIVADSITTGMIQVGAIKADQIAAGEVRAGKLAADSVVASNILAGAVTAAKINVINLAAIRADLGTITAGTITASGVIDVGTDRSRVHVSSDVLTFGYGSDAPYGFQYAGSTSRLVGSLYGTECVSLAVTGNTFFREGNLVLSNSGGATSTLTPANVGYSNGTAYHRDYATINGSLTASGTITANGSLAVNAGISTNLSVSGSIQASGGFNASSLNIHPGSNNDLVTGEDGGAFGASTSSYLAMRVNGRTVYVPFFTSLP
jgi:hypothetical protein